GQRAQETQVVKGVAVAGPVAEVAEQRRCPGEGCGGGRVVSGIPLQCAQRAERAGLAGPVAGLAGCRQGAAVEGGGLVPVAPDAQEAADRGGGWDGWAGGAAGGWGVRGRAPTRPGGFRPTRR